MAIGSNDITFLVPGEAQAAPAPSAASRGSVTVAIRVGATRAGGEPLRVRARPGEDVVVLEIANGPTLVLHPQNARDLMRAQAATPSRGAAPATGDVLVPAQLGWPGLESQGTRGATRGWMGQALLTGFHVVSGLAKDPASSLIAAAMTKKVDGAVEAGVYALAADALAPLKGNGRKLDAVPAARDGGPLLVLVHGTFSDTPGTFGKLWTLHNPVVRQLFARYGDRVYGLDHPTLGVSPIANALTLVRALPAGARIHLLTHSRGGLVAEILARACGGGPLDERRARAVRRSALRRARERPARAGQGSAGEGLARRARGACRLPVARHLARFAAARRLPVDPVVVPAARRHSGGAAAGRFPARGRAPARRSGRAARPRSDDAVEPGRGLAEQRRRADSRRPARDRRRLRPAIRWARG